MSEIINGFGLNLRTIFDDSFESDLLTELKNSEHNYQSLVDTVEGIVWQADPETFQFSFVSKSAIKLLGYPIHEWLDDPGFWKDHIHPKDKDRAVAYCIRCTQQKRSHQLEYRMIAKDGKTVYIHDNISVIAEDGKAVLLRGIMTDITQRKKARKELQLINERLLFHLENSPVAFIEWDADIRPKLWSKRAEEIFGWTEKEAKEDQSEWFTKVFKDDVQMVQKTISRLINGEIKKSHSESRNYTKDGRVIWCEWFNSVLTDNDGKVITILSLILDITGRKNAEEELKKLSMVAKETTNGVVIRDKDQNVVWINNAFTKMYGYELNEIMGKNPMTYLQGSETDPNIMNWVNKRLAKKYPFVFEIDYYTKHSEKLCVRVQVQPIFDEKGDVTQSFALHTDITEQKRLAEQVEVEKIIKLKEITDAVFATQESERSDIGRELHDNVNQLLGATHLYIELAKNDGEKKSEMLQNASVFTLKAIDELRKLSKTLITPLMGEIALTDIITELIEDIMLVHPVRISFTGNCCDDRLSEKFKLNIYRIVQEQVNNILKHAKAENIYINLEDNFGKLLLSITDNGIGFDTGTKRSGVGIANIKSRSELYNGYVRLNSEPGKGTTLSITFNIKDLL